MFSISLHCAAHFTRLPWTNRLIEKRFDTVSTPCRESHPRRTTCIYVQSRPPDQLDVAQTHPDSVPIEHQPEILQPSSVSGTDSTAQNRDAIKSGRRGAQRNTASRRPPPSKITVKGRETWRKSSAAREHQGPHPTRNVWKSNGAANTAECSQNLGRKALEALERASEGEVVAAMRPYLTYLHSRRIFSYIAQELASKGNAPAGIRLLALLDPQESVHLNRLLDSDPAVTSHPPPFPSSSRPTPPPPPQTHPIDDLPPLPIPPPPSRLPESASVFHYTAVLGALGRGGNSGLLVRLFSQLLLRGPHPDTVACNVMLGALITCGEMRRACELLQGMRLKLTLPAADGVGVGGEGGGAGGGGDGGVERWCKNWGGVMREEALPPPDPLSYTILLGGVAGRGEWRAAVGIVYSMEGDGFPPSDRAFNKVMMACEKGGAGGDECLEVLRRMEERGVAWTNFASSLAIKALGKEGRWREARDVLGEMRRGGRGGEKPDLVSYNVFVNACRSEGGWSAALEAMEWMKEDGCSPDRVTYNTAIRVCRQAGQWAKAQEVFGEMERVGGLAPDSVTWSELIRGHTEAGEVGEAVGLFWRVRGRGERVTSLAYNAALRACGKGRVGGEAERIWRDMQEQSCVPSLLTYSALLNALGRSGQVEKAMTVYGSMRAHKVKPDSNTFAVLLDACAAARDVATAQRLMGEMEAVGVPLNTLLCNLVLKVFGEAGRAGEAVEMFRNMLEEGLHPDGTTFSTYLPILEKAELAGEALHVFTYMQHRNLLKGPYVPFWYSKIIGALAHGGQVGKALTVYGEAAKHHVDVRGQTFLMLMAACEAKGSWEKALFLLEEYRGALIADLGRKRVPKGTPEVEERREPAVEAYNLVIGACEKADQPLEALRVYEEMLTRGVAPNMSSFAVVISALQKGSMWQKALAVYDSIPMYQRAMLDREEPTLGRPQGRRRGGGE